MLLILTHSSLFSLECLNVPALLPAFFAYRYFDIWFIQLQVLSILTDFPDLCKAWLLLHLCSWYFHKSSPCNRSKKCIYFLTFLFFLLQVKHTHTHKKLHRINKVIKRKKNKNKKKNSEFTRLHGNILTNIKLRYSIANSIYYIILSWVKSHF